MKYWFYFLFFIFVLSEQRYISPEVLNKLPDVNFPKADATESDVIYYLFTTSSQKEATVIDDQYVFPIEERIHPLKIFIHGYSSNVTTPWYRETKVEYFLKGPHNIVYIDWSAAGNKSFSVSAANIKPVGNFIANFIINSKIPLNNIHLIGHSLGSHLAGFIGKEVSRMTRNKISRITGTDPAGPGFTRIEENSRLSDLDANFVDVIHTDIGYYGITKPIGHADFYANGGKDQPGCPIHEIDDNCSHARSTKYFTESINYRNATARSARFTDKSEIEVSSNSDQVVFGDATPAETRGIYYLKTNSTPPYLS